VDANISELVTAVDKAISEMELIGADVDNFGDLDLIAKYNADASTYVASTLVADLKLQSLGGLSDKDEAARQRILAAAGL
jgi:acyl-[acyl-carrier-protein] desaturase